KLSLRDGSEFWKFVHGASCSRRVPQPFSHHTACRRESCGEDLHVSNIQLMAAEAALGKMLRGNYFDICTIDRITTMLCIKPDRKAYDILSALHCVHYSDMSRELLDALPELIHKVLQSPAFEA